MKPKILTIIFLLFGFGVLAQNLVPNFSFEEYNTCPDNISQVNYLKYWKTYRPTPDYFNSCSFSSYVSVPYNMAVYQCPANGNSYCGFWAFHSGINNLREYIGCKLIDSLELNKKYFISIKFNLSNNSNCGINKIGVLLTTKPYDINYISFTNKAHLFSQNVIVDSLNWNIITGSFISDSIYKYIIVGNLFCDSLTTVNKFVDSTCLSYYLVDDVCISDDSLTCIIMDGQNICDTFESINSDNSKYNDIFVITNPSNQIIIKNAENYVIQVYNSNGESIKQLRNSFKNEIIINDLKSGIYFLRAISKNNLQIKKIIILN